MLESWYSWDLTKSFMCPYFYLVSSLACPYFFQIVGMKNNHVLVIFFPLVIFGEWVNAPCIRSLVYLKGQSEKVYKACIFILNLPYTLWCVRVYTAYVFPMMSVMHKDIQKTTPVYHECSSQEDKVIQLLAWEQFMPKGGIWGCLLYFSLKSLPFHSIFILNPVFLCEYKGVLLLVAFCKWLVLRKSKLPLLKLKNETWNWLLTSS